LGVVIGEGTIKLQPHIIKKIVNFNEETGKDAKNLWMHGRMGMNSQMEKGKEDPRECTGEMKELAAAALHSVKEVLYNGIEMLIGANFLRFMRGGIRIEGDEITIYKKVTRIKTSNQTEIAEIAELEVSEE
nr:ORFIII-like polyprotein [Tanacetum cinerariifolium]